MCEIYHYDIMSILKWTFRFGLNLGAQPTYSESVGHVFQDKLKGLNW